MSYTCADLPFTTAHSLNFDDIIAPGKAAVVAGYAGGGKKRKLRKKKSLKRSRKSMKRSRKSMKRSMKRSRKSLKRSRRSRR